MRKMRRLFLLIFVLSVGAASALELNCKVNVNYSQIQGTSTQVFKTPETSLTDFINGRKWTNAKYDSHSTLFTMSVLPRLYTETKKDELVNTYSRGAQKEKEEVCLLLTAVNPSLVNEWNKIKTIS